jgi:hypothetical protein
VFPKLLWDHVMSNTPPRLSSQPRCSHFLIYRPRSESTSICASRRKINQLKSRERHCTTACNAPAGKFAMKLHARSGRPPFNTTKSSKRMAGKVPVVDEDLCGTRSEHRRRGIASLPFIWWPDLSKDTCATCFSTTLETQCNFRFRRLCRCWRTIG